MAHKTKSRLDDTLFPIVNKVIVIILYLIAFLIILDYLGIEISPLIASLGIAGLAVALALQDTLSNFFAALYMSADKPVRKGDYIQVGTELEGYVEEIGWRSTKIRTLPNNFVIIPNAKLAQSTITNYNVPKKEMSVLVNVGVSYDSDLKKVEKITIETAKKVLKKTPGGVEDFEPFIRYNNFGDSSIDFTVILRTDEFVNKYLLTHEFIKALKEAYDKAKITIPFPIRTVYMKK
jgi:small-conductance mechanosensitive channel